MNKHALAVIMASIASFNAYSGIYSGLNLGINSVTVHKELFYPLEEEIPTSSSFNNAYTNFHGQLLVGYDFPLNDRFSAALEGNADLFTGKSSYKINQWFFDEDVRAEERLDYGFSLFLLPSYQLNEAVRFFAGPGITRSNFVIETKNTAGNVGVSANFRRWLTGSGLKAGTVSKLTPNLALLLTYQFTQYERIARTQIEPLSEETLHGRYKPHVNTVLVGLKVTLPEQ